MTDTTSNAQWIVNDLINNDEHSTQAIESLSKQYAQQTISDNGLHSNNLDNSTMKIVYDTVLRELQQHPNQDRQTISPQDMADARTLVIERVQTQSANYIHSPGETSVTTPEVGNDQVVKEKAWPRVNFPNDHTHPYTMTAKDGKQWQKMIVTMPQGTTIKGTDLTGFATDRFMSKTAREDKINGKPITVTFKPGEPVRLFKGKGEQRESITIADPWEVCKAVKAARHTPDAIKNNEHAHTNGVPEPDPPMAENQNYDFRSDVNPERGEYMGDGIPRTAGGFPYEPLSGSPITDTTAKPDTKASFRSGLETRAETKLSTQHTNQPDISQHNTLSR